MFGRRAFLKNAMVWVPTGVVALGALLAACGDSSSGSSADESSLSTCSADGTCDTGGDISDAIASNHSNAHTVELTQAEVDADAKITLALTSGGTDNHTHTVTLTAAMLTDIADGFQLHVDSSTTSGHSHCVTFNCSTGSGGGGGYLRRG